MPGRSEPIDAHRESFTVEDLMRRHNFGRSKIYDEINRGNLRSYKMKGHRRFTRAQESDWIANCIKKTEEREGRAE